MIGIIDYGMGNLRSVAKALEKAGGRVKLISKKSEIKRASAIVLPGVGAFGAGIKNLKKLGLVEAIKDSIDNGVPFLGICLGYQLLFKESSEMGKHRGLGIIDGRVKPLKRTTKRMCIPHMGWNSLDLINKGVLFKGLSGNLYTYFVHSYYCEPTEKAVVSSWTKYGVRFAASIQKDNIMATQFHPEKSSAVGMKMLENFVEYVKGK